MAAPVSSDKIPGIVLLGISDVAMSSFLFKTLVMNIARINTTVLITRITSNVNEGILENKYKDCITKNKIVAVIDVIIDVFCFIFINPFLKIIFYLKVTEHKIYEIQC